MFSYFDINKVAEKSGLPEQVIKRIKKETREEFPVDDLMYELHLMRAIKAESFVSKNLKREA